MLKLKSVNFAQQQFHTYHLDQTRPNQMEWLIGRNPTCDLVLSNPEVSRVHGRIFYNGETYHFADVESTSGSLLNGTVIAANDEYPLNVGDLLQIGETLLYVEELYPPSPLFNPVDVRIPGPIQLPWEGDLLCRCCRIIDETVDVKTFCFVAESPLFFNYKPGQFINLEVDIDGKSVIRPYSISSSPTRPYHLSVTVKRVPSPPDHPSVPPGLVSNWLHDHLRVGDRVKLIGSPMGHFTCLPNLPSKLLLISAGSGITPMMSMSRWVQDTLAACDIFFLHSARTPADIVFRNELEMMALQMPNFHLAVTLTQPTLGHAWMGLTGRISQPMLNLMVPDLLERAVFVCGPAGFMQGIKATLQAMNFPMQHYQEESFGGIKPAPVGGRSLPTQEVETVISFPSRSSALGSSGLPTANGSTPPPATSVVRFTQAGQDVAADGHCSILELAEQEGILIRSACRSGVCGACKVLTHHGKVEYRVSPSALTATDQQAGYVLACIAYPVEALTIEA